jgi:hypothetical protein
MEMMPEELTTILLTVAICLPIGLAIGALLRFGLPQFGNRSEAWFGSVPWWVYAFFAIVMLAFAVSNATDGRWIYMTVLIGFAILDINLAVKAWRHRSLPATRASQVTSSSEMPDH